MRKKPSIKGVYAVTPDMADTALLLQHVKAALNGGATIVQYRNKSADDDLRREQATALLAVCQKYSVPLIINDHASLCKALDADGVHLGGEDGNIASVRELLGPDKIIGTSCYNRLELAVNAQHLGADYIAFGACFDSGTKPAAARASLELLTRAKHTIDLPIVAIGGITTDNAHCVIDAGADALAIINALFAAPDIRKAAQTFSNFFKQAHHEPKSATV